MTLKKLPRAFYLRPTLTVAKEMLGKNLVRRFNGETLIGRIVEVEAYLGERDPASHAFRGRTQRNAVMFGEGGHLYVYFTYGMHYCCNVVTEQEGTAGAVLLRALEPIDGIEIMKQNRSKRNAGFLELWSNGDVRDLTNGPAKLCEAFGIKREDNGTDLLGNSIFITTGSGTTPFRIRSTTRIGITTGIDKRWRFLIDRNPWVSK